MNFIKRCAATALCLSVIGGTAATLNNVDSVKLPVVATVAEAASVYAPAGSITVGNYYYYKLSDGTYTWCGAKDTKFTTVTIPATITVNGKTAKVTEIGYTNPKGGQPYTAGTKFIETVNFAGNVKIRKINDGAFMWGNLKNFNMNDFSDLTTIGKWSFQDTNLTSFNFANAKKLTLIDNWAFAGTKLANIHLRNGVLTELGARAFKGVPARGWVYIPSTLEKIGDGCFEGCNNITGIGCDPNDGSASGDLWTIGHAAFKGWTGKEAKVFLPFHYRSITCGSYANGEAVFGATSSHKVTAVVDFEGFGMVRSVKLKSKEDVAAFKAGYLKFQRSGKKKDGRLSIVDATGSKDVVLTWL